MDMPTMGEKIRDGLNVIPGWLPVVLAILGATWWVSSTAQSINDRLGSLEHQMIQVQEYLRNEHRKPGAPVSSMPPDFELR